MPEIVRTEAQGADLLVWDLFDERLGVHDHADGSVTTDTVELRRVLHGNLPTTVRHLPFGSAEHLRRFERHLHDWRSLLEETDLLSRSVLLAPPWAEQDVDGRQVPSSFGTTAAQGTAMTATYLEMVARVVGIPMVGTAGLEPRADPNHRWGEAPFHYDDDTYMTLADGVVAAARAVHGDGVVRGRGVRRRPSPGGGDIGVSLEPAADGLQVEVSGADSKAWSVHLYRGGERVTTTSWVTDSQLAFRADEPGVYRVRAHFLGRDGSRRACASRSVRVPG